MAWCPKCKLEYREGIAVCSDCGSSLVDVLTEEENLLSIMTTGEEELAEKFLEFLTYSDIHSGMKTFSENTMEFTVMVSQKDEKEAKKLFKGFYTTETNEIINKEDVSSTEQGTDKINSKQTSGGVYVKREDRYKDLTSSAQIFYVFGVIGILFVLINALGVISFINGTFSYLIYSAMFLGCLIVGFKTQQSAKKAKQEIAQENEITTDINEWLKTTVTEELFQDIDDENSSEEVKYLTRTNHIKDLLLDRYKNLDEGYADQLIEEYYNDHF